MTKIKVAIIEDELPIVQMYRTKFEKEGYDVGTAGDGVAGLELIASYKPDVILLDINMPRLDGVGVLQRLSQDGTLKTSKVIVLTNLGETETADMMRGLPVTDYIVKANLTPSQVVERVRKLLKG